VSAYIPSQRKLLNNWARVILDIGVPPTRHSIPCSMLSGSEDKDDLVKSSSEVSILSPFLHLLKY
jgi:hypothetical protein